LNSAEKKQNFIEEGGKKMNFSISIEDIIIQLFDILEKVQNFLFNFGDIAQKFFDMLP